MKSWSSLIIATITVLSTSSSAQDKYMQKGVAGSSLENSAIMFEDYAVNDTRIGLGIVVPNHRFEVTGDPSRQVPAELGLTSWQQNVIAGTKIGSLLFRTYDASASTDVVAGIDATAADTFGSTYRKTDLVFRTSDLVSDHGVERMRLHYDGTLTLGTSTHSSFLLDVGGTFRATGLRTEDATYPNVVGGSSSNAVSSGKYGAVIGGGNLNEVDSNMSSVGGGQQNEAGGDHSVVGGGYNNDTFSAYSAVLGGNTNLVDSLSAYSVIVGGSVNSIYSGISYSFIGGGAWNTLARISDYIYYNAIVGGYGNEILGGNYNILSGGYSNYMENGSYNSITGGRENDTYGNYNTVLGGRLNRALGGYSLAAGYGAIASYNGSFVFGLYPNASGCSSTAASQFKVCAVGGAWFSHNVSADSFTDRTPYPQDLETAYAAVFSMQRLPDGQYDPEDSSKQLDHANLAPFVAAVEADGTLGRNLSATVSAQNEVIKNLIERISVLEFEVASLKARMR